MWFVTSYAKARAFVNITFMARAPIGFAVFTLFCEWDRRFLFGFEILLATFRAEDFNLFRLPYGFICCSIRSYTTFIKILQFSLCTASFYEAAKKRDVFRIETVFAKLMIAAFIDLYPRLFEIVLTFMANV
eukprot:TRINITY_DN5179_c0_g1_i3.p2 TRINITY_DN5179_c0_g1~~TRINITY_DN5179_c0_g1_i3.p2  ORF type:complete len:131 (-),score=10.67 TRINITY_DN5179_c0_g1_i3:286-678(-)